MDALSLADRVAVVTGAGKGIGKSIACVFAEAGAHVAVAARTCGDVEETAAQVRARGRRALAAPTDVCDPAQVQSLVDRTLKEFGRIDILVNNAGGTTDVPLIGMTLATFEAGIRLNLTSAFVGAQAVIPVMMKQGKGTIINISSDHSFRCRSGVAHYSVAKAGLNQLTRFLAVELAPYGIRVNAVAPGSVSTGPSVQFYDSHPEMKAARLAETPMRRFGQPDEAAYPVLFLASDVSSYITGAILRVTGGTCLFG